MLVGTRVAVGMSVCVGVALGTGVAVGVAVGSGIGVLVGCAVASTVGTGVSVITGATVAGAVAVGGSAGVMLGAGALCGGTANASTAMVPLNARMRTVCSPGARSSAVRTPNTASV